MPGQKLVPNRTSAGSTRDVGVLAQNGRAASNLVLTEDQIERWAQLTAAGQDAFPPGLSASQERTMLEQVRLLRRRRLVRFITRRIAQDIFDSRAGSASEHGGST
jgi:hypothetical protein